MRDDAELVVAARSDEPDAFGLLVERWFDRCWEVAWRILHDRELAADVAQDTLLRAWQHLDRLEQPASFGGWVLRIARNRALDRLERERRAMPTADEEALEPVGAHTTVGNPEAELARSQQHDLVWAAAAALGERDASLLDLHLRHGLEPGEIAEELGIAPNAAHQALFRLRKRLGSAIQAWLLWRQEDPTCVALRAELATAGVEQFDAKVARYIQQHVEGCLACEEERDRVTAPAALFSAVPLVAAPAALKAEAVRWLGDAGVPVASSAPGDTDVSEESASWPRNPKVLLSAAAIVGVVGAGLLSATGLAFRGSDATSGEPPEPPILAPSDPPGDTAPPAPTGPPITEVPTGPVIRALTTDLNEIWEQNPVVECGPTSSPVSATVAGASSVELRWEAAGSTGITLMEPGEGDVWSATLGPFLADVVAEEQGSVDVNVIVMATNDAGTQASLRAQLVLHDCTQLFIPIPRPTISALTAAPDEIRAIDSTVGCQPDTTASRVVATVEGATSVELRWEVAGSNGAEAMRRAPRRGGIEPEGGDRWTATLGPFEQQRVFAPQDVEPAEITVTVVAINAVGQSSQAETTVLLHRCWFPPP